MTDLKKIPLIIISGPTSVGKTGLSIRLACEIDGEIISADSMQVYKGMDIGSAKIMPEEMCGIKHHLIDIYEPEEEFNISAFKDLAQKAVLDIYSRGKIPIVVGGTGFYIQALIYDVDFSDDNSPDNEFRTEMTKLALEKGNDFLFDKLRKVDPKSCEIIHPNNVIRVIRALEFYNQNKFPISEHNEEMRERFSPYNFAYFVLNDIRENVYERIDTRVDLMLQAGLVEEVKALKERGLSRSNISMQGLGYKEILDYLDGEITLDEAIYRIKRDTRHFAKRQITWFKREREVIWVNKNEFAYDENRILEFMINKVKELQ